MINYGEVFREKMAKGDWDVKSVDMEKVNQSQATLVFGQMNEPPEPSEGCFVRFDGG